MAIKVPDIDSKGGNNGGKKPSFLPAGFVEAELSLLNAEAKSQKLANKELSQRYWLRWLVVVLGLTVIASMFALLWHVIHQAFFGPILLVPRSFAVAMLVTPIISITTITVVFFVAAFRRFSDADMDNLNAATSVARNAQAVVGH